MAAASSDDPKLKELGLMQISRRASELMPKGKPDYAVIRLIPSIEQLIELAGVNGRANMHKALQVLIQSFCDSVNVVRNMHYEQVFDTATFLLDECEGFRLEDYVIMFTMAKRGQLVKIYDRIDITVITAMLDAYWDNRNEAGQKIQEKEVIEMDNLINSKEVDVVPEMKKEFTDWLKQLPTDEPEKPIDRKPIEAYVKQYGINIKELQKQFPLKRFKKTDNGKMEG